MTVLFVNAAFRDGSRTEALARRALEEYTGSEIVEIDLGGGFPPLDRERLRRYNEAVAGTAFDHPMFDAAKQFADADEIVIAAPFWNFGIPAALHAYLEMVCTQGITFDLSAEGSYYGKCRAKRLTFVTTAGGFIPESDHSIAYIDDLCRIFWEIPHFRVFRADGLDIYGADVPALLEQAMRNPLNIR